MALAAGDRVALVATAGPIVPANLARAQDLLRSWDLVPVTYPSASARHHRANYLAGTDEQRAADLQDAWCDPATRAIFCLRGGYGTTRLLDRLDVAAMAGAAPKPVLGSSDVTALHAWLADVLGPAAPTVAWFSPMLASAALLDDEAATRSLHAALFAPDEPVTVRGPGTTVLAAGPDVAGPLVGGTVALLASTLGAGARPDHRGAIALLEDVGEQVYQLDRYLVALLRAGWFDGVAGIALGSWKDCAPVDDVHALVLELLGPLGVPIVGELGFGHGPAAPTLPLGTGVLRSASAAEAALICSSRTPG